MNKKNGFTLIELLAIIVILAVIAVITVPIILNIIENAKKGAVTNSAYGYKDSINKWYVTKLSSDSNYTIPDGDYKVGELGEQIDGQKPDSDLSWFKIIKNDITEGCLQFDEYKVEISSGKIGNAVKGECTSNEYVPLTGEVLENIASYNTMEIVYYNPIDGVICEDYVSNNSIPEYKGVVPETNTLEQTSCLKWYKYSTNTDGSINMILDHNTDAKKPYSTNSSNSYGPSNLIQYLTFSEWSSVPVRNDKYTAYVDNDGTKTEKFTQLIENAINYSETRARLITAQEVAIITGANETTSPGISWNEQSTSADWFYFDSKNQITSSSSSNYYWLFENLKNCAQYGCINQNQSLSSGMGYWTSSPYNGDDRYAWYVNYKGALRNYNVLNTEYGVRPVITIPVP